ncbi:MFS transporter [Corynebacterium sp. CCM 8862]|uniref:MFS transporter n=1 Tax=Corynebacterium mendelii TaxID=2765362 RepID=A0A939IUC5_9CORY|nr:MFS transporter [Corynebacterium mendelii]
MPVTDSPTRAETHRITPAALVVWLAALAIYVVAVTGRTSFGVASVGAMRHFTVTASQVAVFTAVQVGVYAAAQIPAGILIDKFGPKKMLLVGAAVMAVGQVVLGITGHYGVAVGARVLIGAGDATAFLSVMRLLPAWFPLQKAPLFTQLTSAVGQLGQFLSAVPFAWSLSRFGWSMSFVSLGAVGILVAAAAACVLADEPPHAAQPADPAARTRPSTIAPFPAFVQAVKNPVCWTAFFTHFSGLSFQLVFTLLWGMPLMELGMGLSPQQISSVLVVNMVVNVVTGPVIGVASARLGGRRWMLVVAGPASTVVLWLWFLSSTGPRGFAALMLVNVVMATFAPVSNLGFDTVRENVDRRILATATGLANTGGFTASMIAAQVMGYVLDYSSAGSTGYQWADFRLAYYAGAVLWAVGMTGYGLARFKARHIISAPPKVHAAHGTGGEAH